MNIEFFLNDSQNCLVIHEKVTDNYWNFTNEDKDIISKCIDKIKEDYPEAYATLNKLYFLKANKRFLIVSRFLRCNFGMSDSIIDIDDDWNFNLEKVFCPLRGGFCKEENLVCNPKLNLELSDREIELTSLLVQEFKFDEIGEMLFISPFTVENHKKKIFKKLGIHTLAQLVNYSYKNNIIGK